MSQTPLQQLNAYFQATPRPTPTVSEFQNVPATPVGQYFGLSPEQIAQQTGQQQQERQMQASQLFGIAQQDRQREQQYTDNLFKLQSANQAAANAAAARANDDLKRELLKAQIDATNAQAEERRTKIRQTENKIRALNAIGGNAPDGKPYGIDTVDEQGNPVRLDIGTMSQIPEFKKQAQDTLRVLGTYGNTLPNDAVGVLANNAQEIKALYSKGRSESVGYARQKAKEEELARTLEALQGLKGKARETAEAKANKQRQELEAFQAQNNLYGWQTVAQRFPQLTPYLNVLSGRDFTGNTPNVPDVSPADELTERIKSVLTDVAGQVPTYGQ